MRFSYEGKNKRAVNYLKVLNFDYPDWVPATVAFLPATWLRYRDELEALVLQHPKLFPDFVKGSVDYDAMPLALYESGRHKDCWGCVWENTERGLDSVVVEHPLADWDALDSLKIPDPETDDMFGPFDWQRMAEDIEQSRRRGDVVTAGALPHGFFFLKLWYLRGFDNLMMDMAAGDPRLDKLCHIVTDYNVAVTKRCLRFDPDMMIFAEDLGLQNALPISPEMWRKYIKPGYEATIGLCRDAGVPVYLHCDGHILEIIDDLIEVGVRVLNPQIRANGLEGLQRTAKGKVALNQDLDRQLFPFASKAQIEDHIQQVYEGLYLKQGGLMLTAECAPDVPLRNVEIICNTLEKVCNLPDPDQ